VAQELFRGSAQRERARAKPERSQREERRGEKEEGKQLGGFSFEILEF
jgi:hypothetical protein